MDIPPEIIAAATTAANILGNLLPKVGEGAAKKIGESAAGKVGDLFGTIRKKFDADKDANAQETLQKVAENTAEDQALVALAISLALKAIKDPAFAQQLKDSVQGTLQDKEVSSFLTQVGGNAHVKNLVNANYIGTLINQQGNQEILEKSLYQLPPDIADFTGREKESKRLVDALEKALKVKGTAVVISTVSGMAGVGKSALAVHVAHKLRRSFPDCQFYVNFRGAEGNPLDPKEVLGDFLRELGVSEQQLPEKVDERSKLFRSLLVDKKALILLDNAHDEPHVRPLLPNCPTCAVLITSRRNLSALEGTTPVDLSTMPEGDAMKLLARLIGKNRVRAEYEHAKKMVRLCGYLPLAIRIAGGTLSDKKHWILEDYTDRLADEQTRLRQLEKSDLAVRASFELSYRDLTPTDARIFCLLGLLETQDFGAGIAGALAEFKESDAFVAIERLVDMQLVEPFVAGRYRFHDLMRLFAHDKLADVVPAEPQEAARSRVVGWYSDMAEQMNRLLQAQERRKTAQERVRPDDENLAKTEESLFLSSLAWFESEREGLVTAVRWAHALNEWEEVYSMAANVVPFFKIRGHLRDWERTHLLALEACQKTEDRRAEAMTRGNLGILYRTRGDLARAEEMHNEALAINEDLGHKESMAIQYGNLGNLYITRGDLARAEEMYNKALAILEEMGHKENAASIYGNLGVLYRTRGDLTSAEEMFSKSLAISEELGHKEGMANQYGNLGNLYITRDDLARAEEMYNKALAILEEMGHKENAASIYGNLGVLYRTRGDLASAEEMFSKSLAISEELGHKEGMANQYGNLGNLYHTSGDLARAGEIWRRSLALYLEMGLDHMAEETRSRIEGIHRDVEPGQGAP